MNFDIPVQEEIRILANALSDKQRKAIFAKMGGGGSGGGNRTPVYTMASPTGTIGGSGGNRPSGPLTVSSISEIPQETPNYRMGDMKLADGTVIPGDKLKDYLGSAFTEESGVINTSFLTQKQKEEMGLVYVPGWKLGNGQLGAIDSASPRFAGLTPSAQVKQDITGTTSTGGGGGGTSTPAGGGSTGAAAGGGGSAPVPIAEAINRIDLTGNLGGPTVGDIAATNLKAFQDALELVHW